MAKNKKYRGIGYSYWNLCETTRTARGLRQRVVASLGKLDEAQLAGLRGGWDLLRGEKTSPRYHVIALLGNACEVQDGLEVRLVEHPDGQINEKYVLCRSTARGLKKNEPCSSAKATG
jgi:hypothetical protein